MEDTPRLPLPRRERAWLPRVLLFAAIALVVNALIGERGFVETIRARREFGRAVADLARLQYDNALLNEQAARLRGDLASIEQVARKELGFIRRGEILVVVKSVSQEGR